MPAYPRHESVFGRSPNGPVAGMRLDRNLLPPNSTRLSERPNETAGSSRVAGKGYPRARMTPIFVPAILNPHRCKFRSELVPGAVVVSAIEHPRSSARWSRNAIKAC
jgi:hypothetical protein